jgi:hypothetical protein
MMTATLDRADPRSFKKAKQWRRLATRHDKLAIVYRGAATGSSATAQMVPS